MLGLQGRIQREREKDSLKAQHRARMCSLAARMACSDHGYVIAAGFKAVLKSECFFEDHLLAYAES